jgi:uncharacterized RmlC-like cupin family protein
MLTSPISLTLLALQAHAKQEFHHENHSEIYMMIHEVKVRESSHLHDREERVNERSECLFCCVSCTEKEL